MTATQIIPEIQMLEADDRARVVEYVRRAEDEAIPATFLEALGELHEGKTIPITDEQFDQPPV